MKHEIALLAVVVAGLGAVGATVAVGSALKEPTVVANPYEAGLHHAEAAAAQRQGHAPSPDGARPTAPCDLAARSCAQAVGPFEILLDLGPRPLRTMTELVALVELRRDGAPVERAEIDLSFEMRGMSMGENRRALTAAGGGRYTGKAVLVRCPSGRKDWVATVGITAPGLPGATTSFDFAVAE